MKSKNKLSALIICLSPHGTTQKAADALVESLKINGIETEAYNLVKLKIKSDIEKLYQSISGFNMIILGAPTYFHHAPAVFTDFTKSIPIASNGQSAAFFASFGGVSSGVVLYDMAKIMHNKNYRLIGGIKVLTEHCLTFKEKNPFYSGHPDKNDLSVVKDFGKELSSRLKDARIKYTPDDFKDKHSVLHFIDGHINKLENFKWSMPGIKVNKPLCNGCGVCVSICPTNNIKLNHVAQHGKDCTYCYSCVRNCKTHATTASLKLAVPTVKFLAKIFRKYENQITQQVV